MVSHAITLLVIIQKFTYGFVERTKLATAILESVTWQISQLGIVSTHKAIHANHHFVQHAQ